MKVAEKDRESERLVEEDGRGGRAGRRKWFRGGRHMVCNFLRGTVTGGWGGVREDWFEWVWGWVGDRTCKLGEKGVW